MIKSFENIYHKYFKDSKINITQGFFNGDSLYITLYLANNKDEVINGIWQNDFFNICFKLEENNENGYILTNIYNRYFTKPKNQYLAYSTEKVAFRKTTGDDKKILKSFEKFVKNLHSQLLEEIKNDNIHENHINLLLKKM